MTKSEKFRTIMGCFIGNTLEWFDFAVYGYVVSIIAKQFFPAGDTFTGLLLTYAVFFIGFVARPFGAWMFGYIGDMWGRKSAIVISNLMMAVPTFMMGLLPTYEMVGIWASLSLMLCRIFQGLSLGGAFAGSYVYLVEQGEEGKKGFFGCWADMGMCFGMILGSVTIATLHHFLTAEQMMVFGWRIPFLSGILLAGVAFFIRSHLKESKEFVKHESKKTPFKELITESPSLMWYTTLFLAINGMGFFMLTVFMPNQTVLLGKITQSHVYFVNTCVMFALMISVVLSAMLCDRMDKSKIYLMGSLGALVFAYPAFNALSHATLSSQLIYMSLFAISMGMCFGARPLFLVSCFPAHLRFTGVAIVHSVGNAVFGGAAPFVATYLVEKTGSVQAPYFLVAGASLISIYAIFKIKKRSEILGDDEEVTCSA